MAGHMLIKDNLVTHAPCYVFDYPDTPGSLNLGQAKDVECLKVVWNEIVHKNPQATIVAIGDCRGSKTLLEFATEQPEKLKALVLLAPFVSLRELAQHIARNYLRFPYADKFLRFFMPYALPNVDFKQDNLAHRLSSIDPKIPVFIAHRVGDSVISYHDIKLLVNALKKGGNEDVCLLEIKDDAVYHHSCLTHVPELQQALNAFYARYGITHNEWLAQEGEEALKKAFSCAAALVSE